MEPLVRKGLCGFTPEQVGQVLGTVASDSSLSLLLWCTPSILDNGEMIHYVLNALTPGVCVAFFTSLQQLTDVVDKFDPHWVETGRVRALVHQLAHAKESAEAIEANKKLLTELCVGVSAVNCYTFLAVDCHYQESLLPLFNPETLGIFQRGDSEVANDWQPLVRFAGFSQVLWAFPRADLVSTPYSKQVYNSEGIIVHMVHTVQEANEFLAREVLSNSHNFRVYIHFKAGDQSVLKLIHHIRIVKTLSCPILLKCATKEDFKSISYNYDLLEFGGLAGTYPEEDSSDIFLKMQVLPWAPILFHPSPCLETIEGNLVIYHASCTDLAPKDSNGYSDPYLKITCDKFRWKSEIVKKSLNPKWHNLNVRIPVKYSSILEITCWDWDGDIVKPDYQGTITVPVMQLLKEMPLHEKHAVLVRSYPFKSAKKELVDGFLTLTVAFEPTGQSQIPPKHFGVPLEVSLEHAREAGLEHVTTATINFLKEHGPSSVGILRVPGNKNRVDDLKRAYDIGNFRVVLDNQSPNDVVGLLKMYLMELPQTLLPEETYYALQEIKWEKDVSKMEIEEVHKIKDIIDNIPEHILKILNSLVELFILILAEESNNKMSKEAIATSIGPSIFLPRKISNDPQAFLKASLAVFPFIQALLHYKHIFA